MAFDPTLPSFQAPNSSEVMRAQLNGLKELIDAIPAGPQGPAGADGAPGADGTPGAVGPQGPPFASAVVDAVNALPHGALPTVATTFDSTDVHFTFGIPAGPPGEVTTAQLDDALALALADRPTVTQMNSTIATAVSDRTTVPQVQGLIGDSLADRPTTAQVNAIAAAAVSDRPTHTQLATALGDTLTAAAANSSANTNSVLTLDTPFADPDAEALRVAFNTLLLALRR